MVTSPKCNELLSFIEAMLFDERYAPRNISSLPSLQIGRSGHHQSYYSGVCEYYESRDR